MKKECDVYTSEDISRFIDHELSSDRCRSFEHHLSLCKNCSERIDQYRSLSLAFSRSAHKKSIGIKDENLEGKLEKILSPSDKKAFGNISGLFGKNLYLKLASIAAVVMIGLFSFDGDLLMDTSTGPSAIVNSVDTEYTSVMILETQKEKHTIIWLSEET